MKIVILGNGISGITAARHIRKLSDHEITVVSDEADYFYSRTALMYVYMGHLRLQDTQPYESWFWAKNRIDLKRARVKSVDFHENKLVTDAGETIVYDKLILALGSVSNKFDWPGQDLEGVHGLYHLQDLEAMERHSKDLKRAVIVGGGLIGVEMAEMFHARQIPVTFLVRETGFWNNILPAEEAAMVSRHLKEHHIDLRLGTELTAILPDESGKKCGVVIPSQGDPIPCGFVGLTTGVRPNIDLLKNTPLGTIRGILVDEYLQTNIPNVYAIGDCAELRQPQAGRRAIEAVWYTGRMMGETVAWNILAERPTVDGGRRTAYGERQTDYGEAQKANDKQSVIDGLSEPADDTEPTVHRPPSAVSRPPYTVHRLPYTPGIWFNSAKFFDIEYQVYGDIQAQLPDNQATLFWEHPDGKKSIRINYLPGEGQRVIGFNLMGVRYRHEVCEKWIASATPLETVLAQLGLANFDPEFSSQYEEAVVTLYNRQTGKSLQVLQKRGLPGVLNFLKGR